MIDIGLGLALAVGFLLPRRAVARVVGQRVALARVQLGRARGVLERVRLMIDGAVVGDGGDVLFDRAARVVAGVDGAAGDEDGEREGEQAGGFRHGRPLLQPIDHNEPRASG
jgi:hypothetical protein